MSDITFKKVTIEDVDKLLEVEKTAVSSKTYFSITDREEAKKEIENNEVYFIIKHNKIVGTTEYQIKNPNHAYLGGLVIIPSFQGQGIARKAAEFKLEKLKNIKRIDLTAHPRNNKIIVLYLSLGFHIESWKDNYFGDGEPRLILALNNSHSDECG
ncbi:MAG: GNAT family N-acetyltransferase [Patescibacteria group bacterium]